MTPSIRPMTDKDIEEIYRLEKEIFADSWSLDMIKDEIENNKLKKPYILEVDNKIAGYAFVWIIEDEVHLNNFAVHPNFRRKGLGLKLIRFIFDEFKKYRNMFLEVRQSNKEAIDLYHKVGFNIFFIRKHYYSNGENAVVMHKELKGE